MSNVRRHMRPSAGRLASLKAVLLGHGAGAYEIRKRSALKMVDTAIDRLSRTRRRDRLFQLAFYHLVRAEVLRLGGDPVPDRQSAQAISKRLRSDLFKCYMELEKETERLLHQAVRRDRAMNSDAEYVRWYPTVSEWSLRQNEQEFLDKATLADILSCHGIAVPLGDA